MNNKKVLLRLDLNVPIEEDNITDDERISRSLRTINFLLSQKCKVVIISHLGRPKGEIISKYSLKPVANYLQAIYGERLHFFADTNLQALNVDEIFAKKEIILLENIRFHQEELNNDEEFANKLARFADVYINDAFSCSHRAHASIDTITHFLPAYKGLLFAEEIENIQKFFSLSGKKMAIIGGKKITGKYEALVKLLSKVDKLAVVGGMANTFIKAQGYDIGKSFYEDSYIEQAKSLLKNHREKLIIPTDVVVAENTDNQFVFPQPVSVDKINSDKIILDIGVASYSNIVKILGNMKAVIWNGPAGLFEDERFAQASNFLAQNISTLSREAKIFSVLGGGDTIACVKKVCRTDDFSTISTGGGAFLDLLAEHKIYGKELPDMLDIKYVFKK